MLPLAELDLEFQTNEGGRHSFATVINSSHFTIHVVGLFIGQGAKAPLGPNEAPPVGVASAVATAKYAATSLYNVVRIFLSTLYFTSDILYFYK